MAQLNQLLTSGSNTSTPPLGYLAMFFAPGNYIGFKDDNGDIIYPTASLVAVTASYAEVANALTPGDKIISGTLTIANQLITSGSTTLGDNTSDTHRINGSLGVNGNTTITGSLTVTNGITASIYGTSSQALTSSYVNTLNQDVTINGNLSVNGTASIAYLNVSYESASVIYSSGSNQFGDASNDTQTLWGTVDIKTGPVLVTGSLNVSNGIIGNLTGSISGSTAQITSITGSLLGNVTGNITGNITGSISGSTAIFNQITASNLSVTSTGSINRLQVTTDAIVRAGTSNIIVGNRGNTTALIFGIGALPNETSGWNFNTAIGNSTLLNLGPGAGNTALGSGAGQNIISGSDNTFIGRYSGGALLSGSNNTFVGSTITLFTGSNNTIIGKGIVIADNTDSNIVLGDGNGNIRARYSGSWNLSTGVTSPSFTGSLLGNVVGNITGSISGSTARFTSITGSLLGNISGNITGSISGSTAQFTSITGSLLGNVVGNITGSISGSIAIFNQVTASVLNITQNATITSNTPNSTALTIQGSGSFSAGNQFDFIKAQNTNVGVSTPYKFFRINSSGSFDIVNSAYDTVIFNLNDSGSLTVTNVTANIFSGSSARITVLTASNASLNNTALFNATTLTSNTLSEAALYIKGSGSTDSGSKNFDVFLLENSNVGVPTPLKYIRLNPSGALEILNNRKDSIFTLDNDSGLNIASNLTASNIWTTNNGTGKNIAIGDDVYFGEINVSNTTQLSGQQDQTKIYLKFASGSNTPILWTTGSNILNLNGSLVVSGGITGSIALAQTASYLNPLTQSVHINGDIKVGNITSTPSGENTLSVYPPASGGTGEGGQILLAASGGLYTSASMLDTYQNQFRILKGTNTGGSTAAYMSIDLSNGSASFAGSISRSNPVPVPYLFQGALSANQSIPNSSDTVVEFVDQFDPQNWWNPSTKRFTPTIAGYYQVSFGIWLENPGTTTGQTNAQLRKNGNAQIIVQYPLNNGQGQSLAGSKIVLMNGSTDYIDLTIYQNSGASKNIQQGNADGSGTWLTATLLGL